MRWIASTLGILAMLAMACGDCGDDSAVDGAVGDGSTGDGASCYGVSCDDSPPPFCVSEDTLRQLGGRCVEGECIYDQIEDAACTDCCYGAEINLTGEPLAGGVGYSEIFSPGDATTVVTTTAELLSALALASDGEIIYVTDTAELDLGDESYVEIPGGVTLASGRGRDGSSGALIFSDSFQYPLFRVLGDGVRLTGLRLRGPNHDIGDHDYDVVPHSGAISTTHLDFEVDNCELWDWGTSAVSLGTGAEGHIHHNYIHHTRRAGLGYGVVLNQSYGLIEGKVK